MVKLPEELKRKLSLIISQAGSFATSVPQTAFDAETALQIDLSASAIALVALVTADELSAQTDPEYFLQCGELAWKVKEIAFLCLDIQETDNEKEIRSLIQTVLDRSRAIAEYAELPKYEPSAEAAAQTELALANWVTTALQLRPEEADSTDNLRAEVRALRELLTSLVAERDNLVNVVLRDIEAAYMRELGILEAEAYRAECDARILKAKMEQLQARLNREEQVREKEVDETIQAQYEAYKKLYEEFVRKVNEAAAYRQQREQQKTAQARPSQEQAAAPKAAGEKQSDPARPALPEQKDEAKPEPETEEQELKRLYRKIVKAMHPDLHPDQDAATKDLFKRAILAYKDFNLQMLREIDAMLGSEAEMQTENPEEGLEKEKARLLGLIHKVRMEIRSIKNRYPYTLKALLDDPVRLEAAKERQKALIENAKHAAEIWQARITEILKKYG